MRCTRLRTLVLLVAASWMVIAPLRGARAADDGGGQFALHLRTREAGKEGAVGKVVEKAATWQANRTAIIICDMWDKHWCAGATHRVGQMAPRMNELIKLARAKGALIVHAPSDTMDYYKDTPQRKLAQNAPPAAPPVPIARWCYLDKAKEGELPIDDSDGGCDCQPHCKSYRAWRHEHPDLEIAAGDAVSDNGVEIYNLMQQRGITNVMVMGVHTNMCVLGRSFGIRQMVRLGKNVVLVRDLTDTMYNHEMKPFVPHEQGTNLVIQHVETHWCPTIASTDILSVSTAAPAAASP